MNGYAYKIPKSVKNLLNFSGLDMNFEMIVIGNELLKGKIKDLNTSYLAKTLGQHNHELKKVHLIPDTFEAIQEALAAATKSADIIITTGGLGPTKDDITKKAFAQFFQKELQHNDKALEITLAQYARGGKTYFKDNHHYHLIPESFEVINNPHGYAPGLHFKEEGFQLFSCPGVPSEFKTMLAEEVIPKLDKSEILIKEVIIRTWKIPEAKIFHHLCPELWDQLSEFGEVSSLPHYFGVDVGVTIKGKSQEELAEKEKTIINLAKESKLNDYIWSTEPLSIEEVVVREAIKRKLTIGFSESCTGGLCASRITNVSGSSAVFWGSVVSYANEVKMKSLAVKEETLKEHGAVSAQTAYEMAEGARKHLDVDIAVSTTGIAGPGGGSKEKPVGTVGIGISDKNQTTSQIHHFRGDRLILKRRFSDYALVTLLEKILSL